MGTRCAEDGWNQGVLLCRWAQGAQKMGEIKVCCCVCRGGGPRCLRHFTASENRPGSSGGHLCAATWPTTKKWASFTLHLVAYCPTYIGLFSTTLLSDIHGITALLSNIHSVATLLSNIHSIATLLSDIQSIATLLSDIHSIAILLSDIHSIATLLSNIHSVATLLSDIHSIATLLSNIHSIATLLSNIHSIATLLSNTQSYLPPHCWLTSTTHSKLQPLLWLTLPQPRSCSTTPG